MFSTNLLFPNSKHEQIAQRKTIGSNDEVVTEAYFEELEQSYFLKALKFDNVKMSFFFKAKYVSCSPRMLNILHVMIRFLYIIFNFQTFHQK